MKTKFVFDPTQYGFLPPKKMPRALKDHLHKKAFVKLIVSLNGSFWYKACHQLPDDRWKFVGGLYNDENDSVTADTAYCGCITSPRFAEVLLIHLFGTTTNEGTLKHGKKRLRAESVPTPRRKRKK